MVVEQSEVWWADAPGNVPLPKAETGLPLDSVPNVSLTIVLDRPVLAGRVRNISRRRLELVFAGIDTILGR